MFHARLRPLRSRGPLARLLAGVVGLLAVAALIALGLLAFAVLAVGGALYLLVQALRSAPRTRAQPAKVLEGEFSVIAERAVRRPAPR